MHAIPEAIASAVVTFPSVEQATNTVVAILQSSAPVARMEFLDEASIKVNFNNIIIKYFSGANLSNLVSIKKISNDRRLQLPF